MDRRRRRRLLGLVAALSLTIGWAAPSNAAWSSSTIDTQWLFTRPSLDIDAADHTGIAYQRVGQSPSIVYSTNATGTWVASTVTTGNAVNPSLRFDTANHPVIAFSRYDGSKGVYLTSNTTGTWAAPTLVASDADPEGTSLAINAAGKHAVAWTSTYSFAPGLYFATDASGAWVKTRITSATWDSGPSMAFDAAGHAHILFARFAPEAPGIYYATNATGAWVTTRLTTQLDDAPTLVLDAAGKVHAAFRRLADGSEGVYAATNATGSWVMTNLEYGGAADYGVPSIALDTSGKGHVVFAIYRREILVPQRGHLFHYFEDTGFWNSTGAEPEDDINRNDDFPSIGFLSNNTLQLAFRRIYPKAALELFSSGNPILIAGSHLDGGPSIALGPSGERDVAFNQRGKTGGLAIFATNAGAGWVKSTAGTGNPSRAGTDIAVDSSGDVRIADGSNVYSNGSGTFAPGPTLPEYSETEVAVDGSLHTHVAASYIALNSPIQWWFQYWTNATGSWVGEDTIPIANWVGFYDDPQPDIALDTAGKPHLAFVAPQGPCCGGGYDSNLFYQNRVSGSWSAPQNVNLSGARINWPSIAIDAAGKVHIAYERYSDTYNTDPAPGIYYATNKSGTWVSTRLTRSYGDGPPSLAMDASGHVYIATTRATWAAHPGVYVMTNATGAWVVSRVYSGAAVDVSLAVTSTGLARMVFDTDTAIVSWENSTATLAAALTMDPAQAEAAMRSSWSVTETGSEPSASGTGSGVPLGGGDLAPDSTTTYTVPLPRPGH